MLKKVAAIKIAKSNSSLDNVHEQSANDFSHTMLQTIELLQQVECWQVIVKLEREFANYMRHLNGVSKCFTNFCVGTHAVRSRINKTNPGFLSAESKTINYLMK